MRESKGNMFDWVTHTWNPIKGKCSHDCSYCYMKAFPQRELRLDDKVLNEDHGEDNIIFVGSSTDVFADDVPGEWIDVVLRMCRHTPNGYLFQTKNVRRLFCWMFSLPGSSIVGTTIETNRDNPYTAPTSTQERAEYLNDCKGFNRVVTIEPIMDFDLEAMVALIKIADPKWVNIGADSKGHRLPEPSSDKIKGLICQLKLFTEVKLKSNLKRLMK